MYCPHCGYECTCEYNSNTTRNPGGGLALLVVALGMFIVGRVLNRNSLTPEEERYKLIQEDIADLKKSQGIPVDQDELRKEHEKWQTKNAK